MQFSCPPGQPDLSVQIESVTELRLPAGTPRHEPEADWYRTPVGDSAVVKTGDGTPLWIAQYRNDGSVSAFFNAAAGVPLTTFIVSEIMNLPRLLLSRHAVVLHASFLAVDGQAILFTAKKRMGKSTQASLWAQYAGAQIINGDRAMIERRADGFYACGLPYAGTSKICRKGAYPIRAVVILSQSGENEVRPAAQGESLRALLEGCTVDATNEMQLRHFLGIAEEIASSVPFYSLRCLPEKSAVDCLKNALFRAP